MRRQPQGTLQSASLGYFECIWPKTVGNCGRLQGTENGAVEILHGVIDQRRRRLTSCFTK